MRSHRNALMNSSMTAPSTSTHSHRKQSIGVHIRQLFSACCLLLGGFASQWEPHRGARAGNGAQQMWADSPQRSPRLLDAAHDTGGQTADHGEELACHCSSSCRTITVTTVFVPAMRLGKRGVRTCVPVVQIITPLFLPVFNTILSGQGKDTSRTERGPLGTVPYRNVR